MKKHTCDVLVVGSGAGGLSAAVTAAHRNLKVLVVEKEPVFGGTTARSGGWMWIPGNAPAKREGVEDSAEKARIYLQHETGDHCDALDNDCDGQIDEGCNCDPNSHVEVPCGNDIGLCQKSLKNGTILIGFQIELDGLLVIIQACVIQAFPADKRPQRPCGILRMAGAFDLDHTRPQMPQHHRAIGPGQHPGQIENSNSSKRSWIHKSV